jgi:peptidoglycan/xylan/chitin deacetylase (PgdA/CDA1 family)
MTVLKLFLHNSTGGSLGATSVSAPIVAARSIRPITLAYHELSSEPTAYRYALSCPQFEDHLRLAVLLKSKSASCEQRLELSFDDGHVSNYVYALPLLEKYHCKATFFVIVGRISGHKDFMTWSHLAEIISLGHRVEAHSWSHAVLTSCTDAKLQTELVRSKGMIEDRLGVPVNALSAPHGRWSYRVLRACEEAGYRRLYTSDPWSRRRVQQIDLIGRLIAVQSLDTVRLWRWLNMGRTATALHRGLQNLKGAARHLLGDKLYYQLWSRFSKWNGPDDYS